MASQPPRSHPMAVFVGENFLNMTPPKGYVAGAGRGAVGFSTQRPQNALQNAKRPSRSAQVYDEERFKDAADDVLEFYDMVELKRGRKRRQVTESSAPPAGPQKPEKKNTQSISVEEWMSLPNATDSTKRNKRLREQSQQSMRFYNASAKLALTQEDVKLAELERQKSLLVQKLREQPKDVRAYTQLADAELELEGPPAAKRVVLQGLKANANNSDELWLKLIELHELVGSYECEEIAKRACQRLPGSEQLWLKRINHSHTKAEKLLLVHEALLKCTQSISLWKLAIDLEANEETKAKVLETAKAVCNFQELDTKEDPKQTTESSPTEPVETKERPKERPKEEAKEAKTEVEKAVPDAKIAEVLKKPKIIQRAFFRRVTLQSPQSIDLWVHRINVEVQDNKPFDNILAEALKHNPQSGKLWVYRLQQEAPQPMQARLEEALKATNDSVEVLQFGIDYYLNSGDPDRAGQLQSRLIN